jgi:hypothetical protein
MPALMASEVGVGSSKPAAIHPLLLAPRPDLSCLFQFGFCREQFG